MKPTVLVVFPGLVALAAIGMAPVDSPERSQQAAPTPHPSTQEASVLVTPEQMTRWETELSNWGRWGPTDQKRYAQPDHA